MLVLALLVSLTSETQSSPALQYLIHTSIGWVLLVKLPMLLQIASPVLNLFRPQAAHSLSSYSFHVMPFGLLVNHSASFQIVQLGF